MLPQKRFQFTPRQVILWPTQSSLIGSGVLDENEGICQFPLKILKTETLDLVSNWHFALTGPDILLDIFSWLLILFSFWCKMFDPKILSVKKK